RLDVELTRELLREVPRAYRTQINDVLLMALCRVCGQWSKSRRILVDVEGHGREEMNGEVDLTRTVGWFTTIYPVLLEIDTERGIDEQLKDVKEQLRRVPNRGVGYGVLKYLSADEEVIEGLNEDSPAEISFNYLGQLDSVLGKSKLFRI